MSNSIKLSSIVDGATFNFIPCTKNTVPAHYLAGEACEITINDLKVNLLTSHTAYTVVFHIDTWYYIAKAKIAELKGNALVTYVKPEPKAKVTPTPVPQAPAAPEVTPEMLEALKAAAAKSKVKVVKGGAKVKTANDVKALSMSSHCTSNDHLLCEGTAMNMKACECACHTV